MIWHNQSFQFYFSQLTSQTVNFNQAYLLCRVQTVLYSPFSLPCPNTNAAWTSSAHLVKSNAETPLNLSNEEFGFLNYTQSQFPGLSLTHNALGLFAPHLFI